MNKSQHAATWMNVINTVLYDRSKMQKSLWFHVYKFQTQAKT